MFRITYNPVHLPASLLAKQVGYGGEGEVLTSAYYDGTSFLLLRGDRVLVLVEGDSEAAYKLIIAWGQRHFDKLDGYSEEPEILSDAAIEQTVEMTIGPKTLVRPC